MNPDHPKTHCIRCGQCCMNSSPTLQLEDRELVEHGHIRKQDLYTIRAGELIHDNIRNRLMVSDGELIKLREKEAGRGCIYYNGRERSCGIYEHRPAQCSAMMCWDDRAFLRVFQGPKLTRRQITDNKILLGLMEEHEKRCGCGTLETWVRGIENHGEAAVEAIIELLKFDRRLRPFVGERLGIDTQEMDLIFGRPLTEVISMFGLRVTRQTDGSFFLSPQPKDS